MGRITHPPSLAFFCKVTATDDYQRYLERIHNQFYLVLNSSKTALVKKYLFPAGNKYLDPKVLVTDTDDSGWISQSRKDDRRACISFLANLSVDTEEITVPDALLQRCIDLDRAYTFHAYPEITDEKSIDDLMEVAGNFHDGRIQRWEQNGDAIYVLFDALWGCKLELWFEGDVRCDTSIFEQENIVPWWANATLLKTDGYYYLVEGDCDDVSQLTSDFCWFRGRTLRYHVIPNP